MPVIQNSQLFLRQPGVIGYTILWLERRQTKSAVRLLARKNWDGLLAAFNYRKRAGAKQTVVAFSRRICLLAADIKDVALDHHQFHCTCLGITSR